MGTQIYRESEVARPTVDPLGSSIADHASGGQVLESFGLRNNEGVWLSFNEVETLNPVSVLCDEQGVNYKEFDSAKWIGAFEFGVQTGVRCAALGFDEKDAMKEATRVFNASEGRAIEEALLDNKFAAASVIHNSGLDLPFALGALEGYMAKHYIGQPTIHLPRALLTPAMGLGLIVEVGGKFFTRAGSKVAAGGGYDTGTGAAPEMIYATGEVWYEKSSDVVQSSFVIPGDGSGIGSEENGLEDNTRVILLERMYRVAVEGPIVGVDVKGWLS